MAPDEAATQAYYQSLPGKRIGAGLICRDAEDRVLLVQPTYKPTWEIPGGVVEAGESPAATVAREVREELGITLAVGRLLVIDWLPVRPPKTEGLMMQFDGGVLDDAVTRHFQLPADELRDWRFFAADELDDVLPDFMARRTRRALELAAVGQSAYLEWGRPPDGQGSVGAGQGRPALVLMKGPPGSGKSTIAKELGRRLGWPVIDKDAVRDLLPDQLGGISYEAMLALAERQLAIGLNVVADSPLGYGRAYSNARAVAVRTGARMVVIECNCSDAAEWRRRIEQRLDTGLAAHHATDWSKVEAFHERIATDPYVVDVPTLKVDSVQPIDRILPMIMNWLNDQASRA
ncbi:MAG: NUDIX domain-containing protein [Chloroflexota bacterium]|nr:NUDIX domain-containing protein [Chloroflexota bacterium]